MHERLKEHNPMTFETKKTALEIFKGCPYILQGSHASCYPNKDPDKGVKYGLITEHCEGPADENFLNGLSLKERWTFFLHTLEGVKAMHDRGYCHFDLKNDNILHKIVSGVSQPRIIDFGVMHPMREVLTSGARGALNFLGVYPTVEYDYIVEKKGGVRRKKGKLEADWSKVPLEMQSFVPIIEQMLKYDPSERISIDSAIEQTRAQLQKLS